jgi:hypothetical protein
MKLFFAALLALSCCLWPGSSHAEDPPTQLVGTWKLVSWSTKFDGGDTVEPYGPNAKGRLVLTPDRRWIIILTGANRKPAQERRGEGRSQSQVKNAPNAAGTRQSLFNSDSYFL